MTAAVLDAAHITVRFGGVVAVNDVNFAVPVGGIVGLVGPNGAGKTTLFEVLSGFRAPTSGTVRLNGDDVTKVSPHQRARHGLGRTFQRLELFDELTVRQHVLLALRGHHRVPLLRDLVSRGRETEAERAVVDAILAELGLAEMAGQYAASLTLGGGRLVEVARALAMQPSVILLDEPSSGLDDIETDRLVSVLRHVRSQRNVSLVLVEHNLSLVMDVCDEVQVLDFGVTIAHGPPAAVQADRRVQAAYIGDVDLGTAGEEVTA